MKTLRFARGWWMIALIAAGVLVAAGPTAGMPAEPAEHGWTVAQTPNPGYYGNIVWDVTARTASDAWAVGVQATETSNDTRVTRAELVGWASFSYLSLSPHFRVGHTYHVSKESVYGPKGLVSPALPLYVLLPLDSAETVFL